MVRVGYQLNPPPGWPPVPEGFVALPGWQPDPSWPTPPPGWQLWVPDDDPPMQAPQPPYGTGATPSQYSVDAGLYPYGAASPPRNQRISGLAIASLVLGLLGAFLLTAVLSVILGIAALADIRRTGKRGKGLTITGFVLSGVWLAIIALVFLPPP
jgi:hypothetical protein